MTSADSGDMEQPVTSQGRKPSRRLSFFRALSRVKRSKKTGNSASYRTCGALQDEHAGPSSQRGGKSVPRGARVEGFLSPSAVSLPTAHAVRLLAWFSLVRSFVFNLLQVKQNGTFTGPACVSPFISVSPRPVLNANAGAFRARAEPGRVQGAHSAARPSTRAFFFLLFLDRTV